ncbi:MAG: hypothetical protein HY397_02640 [Candidatus Doudnabacteria bacterium]|nr:hypothetical protein [Candidatus Doudnabacteria bacterium]
MSETVKGVCIKSRLYPPRGRDEPYEIGDGHGYREISSILVVDDGTTVHRAILLTRQGNRVYASNPDRICRVDQCGAEVEIPRLIYEKALAVLEAKDALNSLPAELTSTLPDYS